MLPELVEEERLDETVLLCAELLREVDVLCEAELLRERELLPDFDPEELAEEDPAFPDEELAELSPVAEDKLLWFEVPEVSLCSEESLLSPVLMETADPLCCDRLFEFDTDGLPPHADKIHAKQRNPESRTPVKFLFM